MGDKEFSKIVFLPHIEKVIGKSFALFKFCDETKIDTRNIIYLEHTTYDFWEEIKKNFSNVKACMTNLSELYQVPEETIKKDFYNFITELEENGIIKLE